MRQKLPSLVEQVLLLTVLGSPNVLCTEQWSRPLSDRRSDDWIPIPKTNIQTRQVDFGRDLKTSPSSVDQIGSLLTPPVPPQLQQQSRVLRNPAPQLTGNFFNQPFKPPAPQPPQSANPGFFQYTTPQPFTFRQQQPQQSIPSQQTFKNEAVNNQFNSFIGQDQFTLGGPNTFAQPQQVLFPQSQFPSPTFFQNQAFGGEQNRGQPSLPSQSPPVPPTPKANEPTRTSKVRFPESNSGEDSREEIQLLYVPVETLQQRGRTPNKLKPNEAGKFNKDGPPPGQPSFFPQQVVQQFPAFPQFNQFSQPEFPPIPQFIDDFNVKHRFNKPQDKPVEKPQPQFINQFIPQQSFQQDFRPPPPKQEKFAQGPPKSQPGFQQEFSRPPKPSTVDFAALQQEFALPDKPQSNFQFEFQQPNSQPNFPPPPPPPSQQVFTDSNQNFPPPPSPQNFQSFQEPQPKFTPPPTTTPKSVQTDFKQEEVSQALNEVTPTKPVFSDSAPPQQPQINDIPVNQPQQLPGMTLAQFAANEQFFPQFAEQSPDFSRPNFDPAPQPQIPQSAPQFERRPPPPPFFQSSEQEVFRPSPPLPAAESFQSQQFPSGRVTNPQTTLPPPHQPPLSVYMENVANSKVGDVLNLLKSSKTIPVLDNVGKDTPQIFVGPSNLEPPAGYVKFELPYLSSLDTNRIERKVDKLPFFVAPLNFQPPSGYSKIPFPAPHIGSVVVSNATILRAALHEKPSEVQGFFDQSTPSPSVYTLPSDIDSFSPHLPSQVNSLQTTPRFAESEAPVTESTTQRRTRYRTTTPPTVTNYQQRRPTSTRQRKPLHRGFPKSQTSTTTTTEIPQQQEASSTAPTFAPSAEQTKTHFGSGDQFIEQTVVPANQQSNQGQQPSNDQNSQQTLEQYFESQQRQQPAQQFDVPSSNQPTGENTPFYREQTPSGEAKYREQTPSGETTYREQTPSGEPAYREQTQSGEPQQSTWYQDQQTYNNQGAHSYTPDQQQAYNQEQKQEQDGNTFSAQKGDSATQIQQEQQQTFNQEQKQEQDGNTFSSQKSEGQIDSSNASPSPVEISSSNYQNILSPSQYHSGLNSRDQYFTPERVPEQTPAIQQTVSSVEPTYQQNEQINAVNEQQYVSQNQVDQNNFKQTESRFESKPQQETTVTSYVEINEPETEKPEKFTKTKNKFYHKTQEHKEYSIPDQSNILHTHQRMNAFLAQEQVKEQETSTVLQSTSAATEEPTTKKLRGRVRGRQRYTGRTSTTESPEEQNYPRNFKTQEQTSSDSRTSQNYPVYQRQTESPVNEETASSSEAAPPKSDKYNTFKRRRPLRPTATSTSTSEESTPETTRETSTRQTRVRVTKAPTSPLTRTSSGRARLRRPGSSATSPAVAATSTTEAAASTESLDWGTYVNSFAPSAGSNEIASPYDDKSITFHNIESHRRNPNYSKVKNDGYWNNGVTVQHSEGVEVNPETFAPTEAAVAASRSYTKADTDGSATTRTLDRKALYRQRLRQGAISNDPENVQSQQNLLRRGNVHKERIAATKKLQGSQDEASYDANSLQQSEGRTRQRGEDYGGQQNSEAPQNAAVDEQTAEQKTTDSADGKKAGVGRRRGAWVRVRVKKPQDVFETAESQSFAKLSGNALKNVDKVTAVEEQSKEQHVKAVSVDQISLVETPSSSYVPLVAEQEQEKPVEEYNNENVEAGQKAEEGVQSQPETVVQESVEQEEPKKVEPVNEEEKIHDEKDESTLNTETFQKDIGDMIREIINGESELDETEVDKQRHREEEGSFTEVAPLGTQEGVSEALVATTPPSTIYSSVKRNQTSISVPAESATTFAPETEGDSTTLRHEHEHEHEEETTTPPATTPIAVDPEPVTKKIVPTSTTTEISLETEICYKGRCIKSKKTKATDLLPSE